LLVFVPCAWDAGDVCGGGGSGAGGGAEVRLGGFSLEADVGGRRGRGGGGGASAVCGGAGVEDWVGVSGGGQEGMVMDFRAKVGNCNTYRSTSAQRPSRTRRRTPW